MSISDPLSPGFYEVRRSGSGVSIRALLPKEWPTLPNGVYLIEQASGSTSAYRLLAQPHDLVDVKREAAKAHALSRSIDAVASVIHDNPTPEHIARAVLDALMGDA